MDKKATTIDEQLVLLQNRGMQITDADKAKEILLDVGFYRLGFYAFPYEKTFPRLEHRTHEYKAATTFADVVDLYYFDYDLRRILARYLNRIEVNLRTYITYTVSNCYKEIPTWFVAPHVMNEKYIEDFEAKVYKTIRDNPVIKRHHQKYINDKFAPAWKTLEFMTLGNICTLFVSLKDMALKTEIAKHYGCGLGVFINYINTIRVIRNSCAHGSCIYNLTLSKAIKNSPQVPINGDKRHNISGVIDVIRYMIGTISRNRLQDMITEIADLLNKPRSDKSNEVIRVCAGIEKINKQIVGK